MLSWILVFVFLFVCALIYIRIAKRFNIVDTPNSRSSHTKPIIRGGGIVFYMAIVCYFVLSGFQYPLFFIGCTLIAGISFIDDLYSLASWQRLPIHMLSVLLVLWELDVVHMGVGLAILLFVIGVVFVNIFNFMDGINGITGLYAISVICCLMYIEYQEHVIHQDPLVFMLLAVLVFGYFNFRKSARFFSGDIGSLSLALFLFFFGSLLAFKLQAPIFILLISVYGADSILTIFYRSYLKENILKPHGHHIYQKLVDRFKWSHLSVAALYATLQLLIGVVVILQYKSSMRNQYMYILSVILILIVLYVMVFKLSDKKQLSESKN